MDDPPGRPPAWSGPLTEVERLEVRLEPGTDVRAELSSFLREHGLASEPAALSGARQRPGDTAGETAVALLLGAAACARLGGVAEGRPDPSGVPDLVAVALRRGDQPADPAGSARGGFTTGEWRTTWTDAEHAAAVEQVRQAIARGDLYQANVVGHRTASAHGDPRVGAGRLRAVPGASYGGRLSGDGWAVASASPEQLVRVVGDRVTTVPVKGTRQDRPGAREELRASVKDRAEHVMIVDLERNDLGRLAVTGTVEVEELYEVTRWSGLWHAGSRVAARLEAGVTVLDVLAAVVPGGSVTGAPKHAACALLADLEPVGRGPSMGAFGLVHPGGLDLGLTIRTVAVADGRAHLWAGGGITWGSEPVEEVAEAHAKAAPVMAALRSGPPPPGPA